MSNTCSDKKIRGRVLDLPRRGPLLSNSLLYGDNYLAVLRKNGEIQHFFISYKNMPHQAHVEIGGMLYAFLERALKCKLDTVYNN